MSEVRRAVRVLMVDEADRVLLLWHSRAGDDDHWAPPGGGVEEGEDLLQAAARELEEETGLTDVPLRRPLWVWRHRFFYHGTSTDQHETLYAVRVQDTAIAGSPVHLSADGIRSGRWWTVAELGECRDAVWPRSLGTLLINLLEGGELDPEQPTELGI